MLISIDKTFDKRDDELWAEYFERKLVDLDGFINDSSEFFDFREIFCDRDGAEVAHELTIGLSYDADDNVGNIRCYCRAVKFREPGDELTGEDYMGDNLDEIKARFISFTDRINAALGLTFSFDMLLKNDLNGASEELLDVAEFSAMHESEQIKGSVKATGDSLISDEGLSL